MKVGADIYLQYTKWAMERKVPTIPRTLPVICCEAGVTTAQPSPVFGGVISRGARFMIPDLTWPPHRLHLGLEQFGTRGMGILIFVCLPSSVFTCIAVQYNNGIRVITVKQNARSLRQIRMALNRVLSLIHKFNRFILFCGCFRLTSPCPCIYSQFPYVNISTNCSLHVLLFAQCKALSTR